MHALVSSTCTKPQNWCNPSDNTSIIKVTIRFLQYPTEMTDEL